MKNHQKEQEAVFTTIVGGRPPGCGTSLGKIPRGIEILIKKACVDEEFCHLLMQKRADAAKTIDLKLEPSETYIIDSIPEKQLSAIITKTVVPEKDRSVFRGKVAVLMLAAIGVATLVGCENVPVTDGIRPDIPNSKNQEQVVSEPTLKPSNPGINEAVSRGVRPDRPANLSRGIQPDRPKLKKE